MRRVISVSLAALAAFDLASSLAVRAAETPTHGHAIVIANDVHVYVNVNGKNVTFTGIMPSAWSYSVSFDTDADGKWGYGPNDPKSKALPRGDISYEQTNDGKLCVQYVYSSYADDPDIIYASSDCGAFKSAATFSTKADTDDLADKIFVIPIAELHKKSNEVHYVIQVWDGKESQIFGSPLAPFVLTLPRRDAGRGAGN